MTRTITLSQEVIETIRFSLEKREDDLKDLQTSAELHGATPSTIFTIENQLEKVQDALYVFNELVELLQNPQS